MRALHHRDEIIRAVMSGNTARIDQLAIQLAQAEELKRLHRALNHCPTCCASSAISQCCRVDIRKSGM